MGVCEIQIEGRRTMEKVRKSMAMLLAVMMLAGALPGEAWAEGTQTNERTVQAQEVESESRVQYQDAQDDSQPRYAEDEVVTVIVEMEAPAVMDYYQVSSYAASVGDETSAGEAVSEYLASSDVQQTTQELLNDQQGVIDQVTALAAQQPAVTDATEENSGEPVGTIVGQWATLVNAMAIRVPYSALDEIRDLDGVKRAYVEQVYDRPEETSGTVDGDKAWYSYSYDKVGVEGVWSEGYTGQGMLVAVLDTGLDLKWGVTQNEDGSQGRGVVRVHEAFTDNSFKNDPNDTENGWDLRYTSESLASFLEDHQLNSTTGADGGVIVWDYNGLYKNLKVPYACDYADGDINVLPTSSDHGTHVSGTVAGYAETSEGEVIFSGVAPDAQIMMMKVFPDQDGGAQQSVTLNALEDALALGADVINLSLGSDNGFADDDTMQNELYAKIEAAGIVLMTSAGNSSYSSASNNYGDNPLTSNVDTAMMSSPAIYDSNLSIASLENSIQVQSYFTWTNEDGEVREISYTDPWTVAMKATFADGKEYPVYLVEGTGTWSDYNAVGWYNEYSNPNGKTGFALVKRGDLSFADKVTNAQSFSTVVHGEKRGILGVLIYDSDPNATELINISVENTSLTSAFINGQDGAAMEAALKAGQSVNIVVPDADKAVESPTDGQMSTFSSWGAGPSLELKPEITAPGGNIWSTIIDQLNTADQGYTGSYGMMSGTSMAAPHMTGIATLVRQYVQSSAAFAGKEPGEVGDIVNQLLVSTAVPQTDQSGVYYSPRQQGAGLVNATAAVDTPAYITVDGQNVGKLELLDDPDRTGSYDITFDVHNISDKAMTYDVAITLQRPDTQTVDSTWGERNTMMHQDVVIKTVELGQVTVEAGQTARFSKTVTLTDSEKAQLDQLFENGVYVEGFVSLTDTAGTAPTLGLPMLAFYGDWTAAPIFDQGDWTDEAEDGENVMNNESTWGVSLMGSTVVNWSSGGIIGYLDLGQNPFDSDAVMNQTLYCEENITISPNGDEYFDRVDDYILYQLRDAKMIVVRVTDAETGEVYFADWNSYITRTLYNASYAAPIPLSAMYYGLIPTWDGTDQEGNVLPSGTKCKYEIIAYGEGDYGDKVYNEDMGYEITNFDGVAAGELTPTFNGHEMDMTGDVIDFSITVDTVAPELENNTVSIYEKDGRTYMTGTVYDEDGSLANIEVSPYVTRTYKEGYGDPNYSEVGVDSTNAFLVENFYDPAVKTHTFTVDVTEYAHSIESYPGENNVYDFTWNGNVLVSCGDYGANDRSYAITVDSTQGLVLSQTSALLHPGSTFNLSVIDNTDQEGAMTRTSSNPDVATIDEFGLVTAVAPGQTVITVAKGGSSAICVVAVEEVPTVVEDFDLSIQSFDGLKPDGQVVVKVDNLQPANVDLSEIKWTVWEDEDYAENYAEGLIDVDQYTSDGLTGVLYLTVSTSQEGLELPEGNGRLDVTLNGVTRSMDINWDDIYTTSDEDDLISDMAMGDQVVYVQQGETAELVARYRQNKLHETSEVLTELTGLQLDGPDFYYVGGTYDGTLVNEEGYELPEEIHLYTRYNYADGSTYDVEIVNYSWYHAYDYDPETGVLHVNYAPNGANNNLVIKAEGVESQGAEAGTMSGQTWTRPDSLYGPFDWTVTSGNGELTQGTVENNWGQEINAALYTPSEPGVSYLTATTKDGQYSVNFAVVCQGVMADTLDLDTHRMDLEAGQSQTLTATLSPEPTLAEDAQVNYISFNPDVASVDENGVVTAHKEGYAYLKVESVADNQVTSYCVVKVTGNMYQVKFVDDTGNIYKLVEVAEGSCVSKPQDPVREGYTFDGWFMDEDGTQAYDFNTPVDADLTLYAHWTKEDTEPTPNPGGAGGSQGGGSGTGDGSQTGGNTKPDGSVPGTGDESNLILPMATLVCAMAGVAVLSVVRRKKED